MRIGTSGNGSRRIITIPAASLDANSDFLFLWIAGAKWPRLQARLTFGNGNGPEQIHLSSVKPADLEHHVLEDRSEPGSELAPTSWSSL